MKKKVTEEQKLEIRELYATGDWSQRQLAKKYGVSEGTINRCVKEVEKPIVTTPERFDQKWCEDENSCWEWQGTKDRYGYGRFYLNGKKEKAHRVAYQLHKEDIPVGQMVRHTCDNRACVNPEHLELGTAEQNTQDKVERYRQPWPFPAVCYLEMKFFDEIGVSLDQIAQHFQIRKETLENRLDDMNKTTDDPTKDKIFYYQKRAIHELKQSSGN
ncbi:HNH endonuclease [Ectobacillus funiculus]|uniref:HNH endonuclease n=1 Tax=Ectobacillus funiculus TaxID=137993 RepID=A0ABV5WPA6_9BACI